MELRITLVSDVDSTDAHHLPAPLFTRQPLDVPQMLMRDLSHLYPNTLKPEDPEQVSQLPTPDSDGLLTSQCESIFCVIGW